MLVTKLHGVACVVAALVASNRLKARAEKIHHLALTLISPLHSDYYYIAHLFGPLIVSASVAENFLLGVTPLADQGKVARQRLNLPTCVHLPVTKYMRAKIANRSHRLQRADAL